MGGALGSGIFGGYFTHRGAENYKRGKEAARNGDTELYGKIKNERLPLDRVGAVTSFIVAGILLTSGIVLTVMEGADQDASPNVHRIFASGLNLSF